MNIIENALEPITGYLILISRDTINGWYEFEIGLPANWVFASNSDIKCEIISENDEGKLINVSPIHQNVSIDDLVLFVGRIIETNEEIAQKEKAFNDKMDELKRHLTQETSKFYKELDDLKQQSFKTISDNSIKKEVKFKPKKGKFPTTSADTVTVITNIEKVG
jgi:hypothetical protein